MNAISQAGLRRFIKPLVMVSLVAVAYLTALNRAQTLPWAIAALLAGTLITGVLWPYWLVQRLSVKRKGPSRAEEGETIIFEVEIENRGWLPRFMIELVDRLPFSATAHSQEQTVGMVSYVSGRSRRVFPMPVMCEKRGLYQLGPFSLASSFPLGLADAKVRRNEGIQTLTVYPDVFPVVNLPLRGAPSQIHRGAYLLPEGLGAAEFSGLREYRRGDNPRHIHWPTTARLNELMTREFEPLASACLYIALDLAKTSNVGQGKHATLEYAIRIAASIARFCCAGNLRVRFSGQGRRPLDIKAASGEHHYQRVLDELAVLDSDGSRPYAEVLQELVPVCTNGETVVVFMTQSALHAAQTLQAAALLRSKGAHLLAVVFDRGSFIEQGVETDEATDAVIGGMLELGAHCIRVKRGDDLVKLFNA